MIFPNDISDFSIDNETRFWFMKEIKNGSVMASDIEANIFLIIEINSEMGVTSDASGEAISIVTTGSTRISLSRLRGFELLNCFCKSKKS